MNNYFENRKARRRTLSLLIAGALAASLPIEVLAQAGAREVRIGYQKYGTLTLLKGAARWKSASPKKV